MDFTRRTFIRLLSTLPLLSYAPRLLARPSLRDFRTTLVAFLDTLMPADDTPAASDLGVPDKLMSLADSDRRYERLLLNGCLWLDNMALKRHDYEFHALDEWQRVAIVERLETSQAPRFARVFMRRVLADLYEFYYSQPRSWPGLGIERPPQPLGYRDYAKPPASKT